MIKENIQSVSNGYQILSDAVIAAGGKFISGITELPPSIGTGYIKQLIIEPELSSIIHHFKLQNETRLKSKADANEPETFFFAFSLFDEKATDFPGYLSSVQIKTSNMEFTTILPAGVKIFTLGININKSLLQAWLSLSDENLPDLFTVQHPFVIDLLLTSDIRRILSDFSLIREDSYLSTFHYKIGIQELLYWLFKELNNHTISDRFVHSEDIEKIYLVKTKLITSLSNPPTLAELSEIACLSEAKLKQLFRKVFGSSPFTFFQAARMDEAKRLLKYLSVTETGYQLGFSNLSHFARLFKKYHKISPKKFQSL